MPLSTLKSSPGKTGKCFPVKVVTMEAEMELDIEVNHTGKEFLELIARTLGLREVWYFGLQYTDNKGLLHWLKLEKKVQEQDLPKDTPVTFLFLAKFYPETLAEDLVQEITQHLFYLQVKQAIISEDIYCPPEAAVLLASYAVQASLGDFNESTFDASSLSMEDLLPQRVIDQYSFSSEKWAEKIKQWYQDHRGMARDEAEMEYLKIAQTLDMFGVNYFAIKDKKGKEQWLGVKAIGLCIYEQEDRLRPVENFSWGDIIDVAFKDKKFSISLKNSKKNYVFISHALHTNKLILELCQGNHDLYVKRRSPEPIAIQQMKSQAREDKLRRKVERERFEQQIREEFQKQLNELKEELHTTQETMKSQDQAADLLAQKAQIADEENRLLMEKNAKLEADNRHLQLALDRVKDEKMHFEDRARKAELFTARLVEDSERRVKENEQLRHELHQCQLAIKAMREKFVTGMRSSPYSNEVTAEPVNYPGYLLTNEHQIALRDPHSEPYYTDNISPRANHLPPYSYITHSNPPYMEAHTYGALYQVGYDGGVYSDAYAEYPAEMDHMDGYPGQIGDMDAAIEKSRDEYHKKTKTFQDHLKELKSEMEDMKVKDKSSDESGSLERLVVPPSGKAGKAGLVTFVEDV